MTQYLVAAEADKIQDLVFRASRLREVFGGSNLLDRFGREVPEKVLGLPDAQIIIQGGGAFRLAFESKDSALEASRTLADLYYMTTGCTISIAEPVAWDGTNADFVRANELAGQGLRAAKRNHAPNTHTHLPYFAFCASTGVEIASDWQIDKDGRGTYLSQSSWDKRNERQDKQLDFLDKFFQRLHGKGILDPVEDAESIGAKAGYDPRNYVAYLLADGNGMGKRFSQINAPDQLKAFSNGLTDAVRDSLVQPTQQILDNYPSNRPFESPVLPLILGGDDLFVLLPAPFALSFAKKFCQEFEKNLQNLIDGLHLEADPHPTVACAVVICKASYPFRLAHEHGEKLLKEAKRRAKSHPGQPASTVNFDLLIGNELAVENTPQSSYQLTLRPYWGTEKIPVNETVPIQSLLDARRKLNGVAQKRRSQLQAFFDAENLPKKNDSNARKEWAHLLDAWLKRSAGLQDGSLEVKKTWEDLLKNWGGEQTYWLEVREGSQLRWANALPDLLDLWNFLYDLDHKRDSYQEVAV